MGLNVNKLRKVNNASAEVYGKSDRHIDFGSLESPVHWEAVNAIQTLKNHASEAGFSLKLASGFRNFDRQCAIWNAKVQGLRPVLDKDEQAINLMNVRNRIKV